MNHIKKRTKRILNSQRNLLYLQIHRSLFVVVIVFFFFNFLPTKSYTCGTHCLSKPLLRVSVNRSFPHPDDHLSQLCLCVTLQPFQSIELWLPLRRFKRTRLGRFIFLKSNFHLCKVSDAIILLGVISVRRIYQLCYIYNVQSSHDRFF